MVRIKVIMDFEEHDGYSIAQEKEIGFSDEALLVLANAISAAQQSVHPTAGTDPLKERLIVDDETLNNPDGWFTSGG